MEIRNLAKTPIETIVECLIQSFEGYFVQLPSNTDYWEDRFRNARVDLRYSFGMYEKNRLVGFIINGIDNFNGQSTAFNTGTGVLPAYRGNKIVDKLYEFAFPLLREKGVTHCRLEVIEDNSKGIRVYERIGFNITRKLFCYKGKINDSENRLRIEKMASGEIGLNDFGDEELYSWDHTRDAIVAAGKHYDTYIVYKDNQQQAGYFTINPEMGYLARIGKTFSGTYKELIGAVKQIASEVKVNNVCESRTQLRTHLVDAGLVNFINQFEMEMKI
ncbi:GNAT family N-acetyltransferase [Antarcticibacterium arcticum]|nr:GNAT family N-acetyltransferase [Antarcticibacterium arcticum]